VITDLGHPAFAAHDVDATLRFYRILGIEEAFRLHHDDGALIVLNGVPIFARGADWIPADSFVGAIAHERYENPISAARGANMNMLRVWGGGIYEHDVFYDLCDTLGLLVWQDFMFACAVYPEGPASFVAEVEAEARYQVGRLRGHPYLALFCGNNENQWIHDRQRVRDARFTRPRDPPPRDTGRPALPSQPLDGPSQQGRSQEQGRQPHVDRDGVAGGLRRVR
jgi:catechol 2,3-dioxygenase-like lactoylglutathione lyase family enzyme